MASSALFRRLICSKGIAGSCASWFHRRGVLTAAQNQEDFPPWLMLSPGGGTTTMSYEFYNFVEKKIVQTFCPSDVIGNLRRLTCRGSSNGWLALLSPDNHDILLYNPISHRHIKLPSIVNLPAWPHDDIESSKRYIDKIILSCSPDEEDCRVVMVRDCSNPLAFCCPGRSSKDSWTLMLCDDDNKRRFQDDCVYSVTRKLFFALTRDSIETWDLRDPSSPRLIKRFNVNTLEYPYRYYDYRYYDYRWIARHEVDRVQYLVVAEQQDLLFVVIQYTMYCVNTDGSCDANYHERACHCRYMTFGFDIYKYDPTKKRTSGLTYVDRSSLGGLAIFVGMHSHSVAIPATRFPGLQPNSIYFTDPTCTGGFAGDEFGDDFGGHDIGVFNYEDKTVSPCYYPCDIGRLKKIVPAPIWFFPSRPI